MPKAPVFYSGDLREIVNFDDENFVTFSSLRVILGTRAIT